MKRKASENDLDNIYKIIHAPEVNAYMSFHYSDKVLFAEYFKQFLDTTFIYEKDKKVIAIINLVRKDHRRNHVLFISKFAISPEFQGQGIGTEILQDVISEYGTKGITRFELIAEEDNIKAISLYKKIGFAVEGVMKNYFKREYEESYINDYFMALVLK